MPYYVYVAIAAAAILLICIIIKIVKASRRKGNHVEEIHGVRYTTTSDYTKEGEDENNPDVKISYNKGDILIPANQERKVGRDADIKPGKYIILSTVEGTDSINIRLGGYVRVYAHGSEVILAEGETITATNIAVILR